MLDTFVIDLKRKALHADFQIEGKGLLREWFRLDNSDLEKIDSHFHALSI